MLNVVVFIITLKYVIKGAKFINVPEIKQFLWIILLLSCGPQQKYDLNIMTRIFVKNVLAS